MRPRTPDINQKIMSEQCGTTVLITDPRADQYLQRARKQKSNPPTNRLSRPCGGAGGFDDYVERWNV
jgi:hypothetical protein